MKVQNGWLAQGNCTYVFPREGNKTGHQTTFKTAWAATLRRAKVRHFRVYDLRSTYATRLSAGGVADEWVTQLLRQGDAKVFKKYSQVKLQMKREALQKINRVAHRSRRSFGTVGLEREFWHSCVTPLGGSVATSAASGVE